MKLRLILFVFLSCVVPPSWGASVDQSAPPFFLEDMQTGETIDLEEYRGKVVYLDFWASWCVPCLKSFPKLSELRETYADLGFEVLAVNVDEHPEAAMQFLERYPVDYPVLHGFGSEVPSLYEVEVMPTAFFIDGEGKIRLVHLGFKDEHGDFIEAVLQKLLAELY